MQTGNHRLNKTLSARRAQAVADALTAKGIAADRITADSQGDTRPAIRHSGRKPGHHLHHSRRSGHVTTKTSPKRKLPSESRSKLSKGIS